MGAALPPWLVDELQHRAVLFLNHVLMREKEATSRLVRQNGSVVLAQWRAFTVKLVVTPAGLFDVAPADAAPDLTLVLSEESPVELAQSAVRGDKPALRIEGDVQLASEIHWLVDHVRWDAEEDLSRLIGDAPAHALGLAAQRMVAGLRRFVAARSGANPGKA